MNPVMIARTALLAVFLATFAVGSDKTPHTYQKGAIRGWEHRTDRGRDVTVFELKGTDLVYLIDYCGAFQEGQFGLGQAVDDRADGLAAGATPTDLAQFARLYIRRDNGEEYKCKIEGQKTLEDAKTVVPPAKP